MAAGNSDGVVRMWDIMAGDYVWQHTMNTDHIGVSILAFSPDGSLVVTGTRQCVEILDAVTGTQRASLAAHAPHMTSVFGAQLDPTNSWLVTASYDRIIKVWCMSPEPTCVAQVGMAVTTKEEPFKMALSAQGRWLAVLFSKVFDIRIWELPADAFDRIGQRPTVELLGHRDHIRHVCWRGDNLLLSVSADTTVRLWAVPGGDCLWLLPGTTRSTCAMSDAYIALPQFLGKLELLTVCCLTPREENPAVSPLHQKKSKR